MEETFTLLHVHVHDFVWLSILWNYMLLQLYSSKVSGGHQFALVTTYAAK